LWLLGYALKAAGILPPSPLGCASRGWEKNASASCIVQKRILVTPSLRGRPLLFRVVSDIEALKLTWDIPSNQRLFLGDFYLTRGGGVYVEKFFTA
jgi:hypothetical protein